MRVVFLLTGIGLSLTASFNYIWQTLRGTVQPNRVSWLMWAFAAGVGVWVTLRAGGDMLVVARLLLAVIMPLLVFAASFWGRTGYWRISQFDAYCGTLSLFALVWWLTFSNAPYAIMFVGLADLLACVPTILKAWRAPETESATSFTLFALSTLIVMPLITKWDIVHAGFTVYLTLANTVIVAIIFIRRQMPKSVSATLSK